MTASPSPLLKGRLLGLLLLLALAPSGSALAQRVRVTPEERLRDLRATIEQDEARLSRTIADERTSLEEQARLDRQIALRRELVATYRHQLHRLALERDSLQRSLGRLDGELGRLKAEYRRRARHAYTYGRLHDLALVLSARSINQMLIRARYLRRFARQRRSKLQAIKRTTATLEAQRARLRTSAERARRLVAESRSERRSLERLQREREDVLRDLRKQRSTLEKELARKRNLADAFEAQIRTALAGEASSRRTREARDPDAALSGSFQQHQGQLPWPADGAVQEPFGDLVNPVHGTVTSNPGVLLATAPSAAVRAVFEGEVTDVDVMPGYGTFLTIRHGAYQSVYSNFSLLYVGRGDRMRTGQIIGRAGTDNEPKGAALFFALFKGGEAVDPVPWLRPR